MKAWLAGALISTVLALAAPVIRKKVAALLSTALQKGYKWLFVTAPAALDYGAVPAEKQAEARKCVDAVIGNLVRLEELLLPDSGLGTVKKRRVLDRLAAMGLPSAAAELLGVMIDDAVRVMNDEAEAALKTYSVGSTGTEAK